MPIAHLNRPHRLARIAQAIRPHRSAVEAKEAPGPGLPRDDVEVGPHRITGWLPCGARGAAHLGALLRHQAVLDMGDVVRCGRLWGALPLFVPDLAPTLGLRPLAGDSAAAGRLSGVSEKVIVEDKAGLRYVAKPRLAGELAAEAEMFATGLRARVGEPTVRTAIVDVALSPGQRTSCAVKPFVPNDGPLPLDPTRWSEGERAAVLADIAWAELVGNYDTKPEQYVRVAGSAVNIDWDRSLKDLVVNPDAPDEELARGKRLHFSPGAPERLLAAYVRGDLDLDFAPLFSALTRVEQLQRHDVRQELAPFSAAAFAGGRPHGPYRNEEELLDALMARRATLRLRAEDLVAAMEIEREVRARGHVVRRTLHDKSAARADVSMAVATAVATSTPILRWGNQLAQQARRLQRLRQAHDGD